MSEGVSVDYRLLERFQASRDRHEAARRALPERWRSDPRPVVQDGNVAWVGTVAPAREQQELFTANGSNRPLVQLDDDR
jgi:hypothetical protein